MKRFLLFAALSSALFIAFQAPASAQLAYAYSNTIELQGGWLGNPYSVNGVKTTAVGIANGGEFSLRYSYFFGRYAGLSIAFSAGSSFNDDVHYFATVNRADGDRYKYYPYGYRNYRDGEYVGLLVGPAFRYDFGRWSLRPRLAVGVMSCSFDGFMYERYDRKDASAAPSYFDCMSPSTSADYLFGNNTYQTRSASFVGFAGLQLAYSVGDHFFFSLEAGYKAVVPGTHYQNMEYAAKDAYDPQTWAQSVYDSGKKGVWVPDYSAPVDSVREPRLLNLVNVSFGVGWNIGWNRNESGWYLRRR